MKVTLDLTRLLEHGKITQAEFDKFSTLAARDTGSLGINILIGFGVVAVAAGVMALVPNAVTGIVLGGILFAAGMALAQQSEASALLARICIVIGALLGAASVVALDEGTLASLVGATVILAGAAIAARSSLLAAAAVLALAGCVGAQTGYWRATYSLGIPEPLLTIVVFSALALATYHASKRLPSDYERLAITAARVSVLMVNFGFWVGSLWGDRLGLVRYLATRNLQVLGEWRAVIPEWPFIVGWALALLAVGAWGVQRNRRWVVNVAAVFGAIHFYTQWFEKLGASPVSVLLGGLLLLAFALGLWRFNKRGEKAG